MATSTQRIALMFLFMNLIVGTGLTMYEQPTTFNQELIDQELLITEQYAEEFNEEGTKSGGIPTTDTCGS